MKSSISRSAAWFLVVAAVDDKTEAVIREREAQHKEAHRSLRRRRDRARGPPTLPTRLKTSTNIEVYARTPNDRFGGLTRGSRVR